jgi:hypothetical protein
MSGGRPTPALAEFPWHVDHLGSTDKCVYSSGGWYVADVFQDDCAEFIIAACNFYAAHLAANPSEKP